METLNGYALMSKSEVQQSRVFFVSKNYYHFKVVDDLYKIPFHFFKPRIDVALLLQHYSEAINKVYEEIERWNQSVSEGIQKNILINRAIADKNITGFQELPYPKSPVTPMPHQRLAFHSAQLFDRYGLLMEMGLGKTKLALDLSQDKMAKGLANKWLITAPLSVLPSWKREYEKNMHDGVTCNFYNLRNKYYAQKFKEDKGLCFGIVNWDSLFKWADEPVDGFIVDESTKAKNHSTKRSKVAHHIADKCKYAYILTGSIITNNIWDVWSQYRIIDGGRSFCSNFYEFRSKYFYKADEYTYLPKGGTKEDISERLFSQAIVIKKDHCLNLPPKIYQTREIEFSDADLALYRQMRDECLLKIQEKEITAPNILTQMNKLRQLTAGFIYDNEHDVHRQVTKSKFEELQDVLDEVGDKKVVIWCCFREEILWLLEKLPNSIGLYGDTSANADSIIQQFLHGDKQYLIANPATGGLGINLTPVDTVIYYSNPMSVEQRIQSEDRTHRVGMKGAVTYIDMVVQNSIDVAIKRSLEGKIKDASKITDIKELTKFMDGEVE